LTENVAFLIDFDPNLTEFDGFLHALLGYAAVENLLRKSNVGELSVLSPLRPPATAGKLRTRRKDRARNGDGGAETGKSIADCGVRIAE